MNAPIVSPLPTLSEVVDRLGSLRAELAELEALEKTLKTTLTDSGCERVEGRLFKAAIVFSAGRFKTDWQTIAERFSPSRQLVAAHTTQGAPFFTVRITSR